MKRENVHRNFKRFSEALWRIVGLFALAFSVLLASEARAQEGINIDQPGSPGTSDVPKLISPGKITSEFWVKGYQPYRWERDAGDIAALFRVDKLFPGQLVRSSIPSWIRVNIRSWIFSKPENARAHVRRIAEQSGGGYDFNELPDDPPGLYAFRERPSPVVFTFQQDLIFSIERLCFELHIDGNRVITESGTINAPSSEELRREAELWIPALRRFVESNGRLNRSSSGRPTVESGRITVTPRNSPQGSVPQNSSTVQTASPPIHNTPTTLAFTSLAVSGLTALGAGLMMIGTGVSPREVIDGVRELFAGTSDSPEPRVPPPVVDDDFEQWKRDYESRGWRYTEKDGVANFEPVEGATNESGWSYSEGSGRFEPPEDQRPEPEVPAADATYHEEVRLLQEDLERQSDLLDRERERLRRYEQAGLKELLPGTNERIREYEKLADLNRAELERLNEDLPTHTVEDNRDLEADAGERLRTRDLIHDIKEGDQRIGAGKAQLEQTQAEIDQIEEEIDSLEEKLLMTPELSELNDMFLDSQKQFIEEGYMTINPGYDAPLPAGKAIDGTVLIATTLRNWLDFPNWSDPKCKAIRCGGFAEKGEEKIKAFIKDRYGDRAGEVILDKVFVDVMRDDSIGGKIKKLFDATTPKNHVANRVILPNGRRYILDYWEGNRSGRTSMVPEEQWLARWKKRIGEDFRYIGSDGDIRGDQNKLMTQVETIRTRKGKSLDEALALYREQQVKTIQMGNDSPGDKQQHLKQIDTLIKSYRRHGRFHSEDLTNYEF